MRLLHMRYFLEISRTQNISVAAKNLHLTQPSLSFAVRALENELGISLLVRHSHSVSLTDAGEKFAAHAERILGSTEQLRDLMHRHSHLLAGNLRLGMLWIGGYMNLFTLLNDFRDTAPAITYELTFDGSDILMHGLLNRRLHCAFVISSPAMLEKNKDIHSVKISTEEYTLIIPKENKLSQKNIISMKDLAREKIIMPSQKTLLHRQLILTFQSEGITPEILCTTSQPDIVSQLTGAGLGIGFASSTVAKKICPASCKVVKFDEAGKIYREIYYVTLNELIDYPLVNAFTNFVNARHQK